MPNRKMVKLLAIINAIKAIPTIIKELPSVLKIIKKMWNIIKGTYYNIFNKKQILADKRLNVCNKCEHKTPTFLGDACGLCGCILDSKTRVQDEQCELEKW